jgi:hypothetical protein
VAVSETTPVTAPTTDCVAVPALPATDCVALLTLPASAVTELTSGTLDAESVTAGPLVGLPVEPLAGAITDWAIFSVTISTGAVGGVPARAAAGAVSARGAAGAGAAASAAVSTPWSVTVPSPAYEDAVDPFPPTAAGRSASSAVNKPVPWAAGRPVPSGDASDADAAGPHSRSSSTEKATLQKAESKRRGAPAHLPREDSAAGKPVTGAARTTGGVAAAPTDE